MNLKQTMAELEAAGTAQNCKIYKRHGATGAMFGVSYAVLDKLAKQLNRDEHAHTLAMELWATGNHDARVLACKIADPEKVRARHVDAMAKQCRDHVVGDALCGLVIKTDVARSRAERWTSSRDEFVSMCGWSVMAGMAAAGTAARGRARRDPEVENLGDDYFVPVLQRIEHDIHDAPNRTRHSMNNALIAIGMRGGKLKSAALAAAKRIGKVEVDHGETSCVTPDAAAYIKKALAHYAKKAKTAKATKTAKKSKTAKRVAVR